MEKICFSIPTMEQAEFSLIAEFDQDEIDENIDTEDQENIKERIKKEDVWAWAVVCVTAKYKGFEGCSYMGGCSYDDENDFKEHAGSFDEMKREAFDDLLTQLRTLAD